MKRLFLLHLALACALLSNKPAIASELSYIIITSDKAKEITDYFEAGVGKVVEGAKARRVDCNSPEGKAWIEKLEIEFVPFIIFGRDIQDSQKFFELAKNDMIEPRGNVYIIPEGKLIPAGGVFFKRRPKPGQLEVFIMGQCPMAKEALVFVDEYLSKKPAAFKSSLHYITNITDFCINSQRGEEEVKEDIYQLLIRKYYPDKFSKYFFLRGPEKGFGRAAEEAGINADKIKRKLEEGIDLLRQDAKLAKEYGVKSSPTFVWEGQIIFLGLDSFSRFLSSRDGSPQTPASQ